MSFERLIRFQADDGKTYYGNLTKEVPTHEIEGSKVEIVSGDVETGFKKTGTEATVSKVIPAPNGKHGAPALTLLSSSLHYLEQTSSCALD